MLQPLSAPLRISLVLASALAVVPWLVLHVQGEDQCPPQPPRFGNSSGTTCYSVVGWNVMQYGVCMTEPCLWTNMYLTVYPNCTGAVCQVKFAGITKTFAGQPLTWSITSPPYPTVPCDDDITSKVRFYNCEDPPVEVGWVDVTLECRDCPGAGGSR